MATQQYRIGFLSMALIGTLALSGCGGNTVSAERIAVKSYYQVDPQGAQEADIAQKSIRSALVSGRFNAIKSFTFTPKRGGVFVLFSGDNGEALVLYGLEDPSHPQEEYTVVSTNYGETISDIKMLGNGKMRYTLNSDGNSQVVTYDYFHKKVIEDGSSDNHNHFPSRDELKSIIQNRTLGDTIVKEIILTPKKGGMFVYTDSMEARSIKLYGLENPWDPQFEDYIVTSDKPGAAQYEHIQVIKPGILQYNEIYRRDGIKHNDTVQYDYFNKREISRKGNETKTHNPKSTFMSYLKSKYSRANLHIERFEKLTGNQYLVIFTLGYRGGDGHKITGVYNIDTSVTPEKRVANENLDGGPGDSATNLRINREEGYIKYHYHSGFADPTIDEERVYWYD